MYRLDEPLRTLGRIYRQFTPEKIGQSSKSSALCLSAYLRSVSDRMGRSSPWLRMRAYRNCGRGVRCVSERRRNELRTNRQCGRYILSTRDLLRS